MKNEELRMKNLLHEEHWFLIPSNFSNSFNSLINNIIMLTSNVVLTGKTVLVTGVAGFIGSNLAKRLLQEIADIKVIGIDNMNDYYDVRLKEERLKKLSSHESFVFIKGDIADKNIINKLFNEYKPQIVVNLAAQAGVRYSITNPDAYISSNLIGFYNILEACRHSYDDGQLAVIATMTGKQVWNTWFTPAPAACTAATRKCLIPPMTRWTIPSACMPQQRKATN